MDKSLCLSVKTTGCGFMLKVNDLVVMIRPQHDGPLQILPIHEFVLQGNNSISVYPLWLPSDLDHVVNPIRHPRLLSQTASIEVKLFLVKDRGAGVLVEPQLVQAWSESFRPDKVKVGARAMSVDVELPVNFERWRWSELTMGTLARERVHGLIQERIEQMCRWVEDREEEPFLRQFSLRVEEYSKAYGVEVGESVARFRNWLGLKSGFWKLKDCSRELDQMRLIPCRGESIFYPVNAQGEAFFQLQHESSGSSLQLGLHFAAFADQLYVVR